MSARVVSYGLLAIAIAAGTFAPSPIGRPARGADGAFILSTDLHVHSSLFALATLTPAGLLAEAAHQGLDAVAVTGHSQWLDTTVASALSPIMAGPLLLSGEELVDPAHHILAIGTTSAIDAHVPADRQVTAIHAQGGLAFAAHPGRRLWAGLEPALHALDGAEVCHPGALADPDTGAAFEAFAARGNLLAIGSSDFHGWGRIGLCRTFLRTTERTAAAVLDALRARRTAVFLPDGRAFGDPSVIESARRERPEAIALATGKAPVPLWDLISRACAVLGALGLLAGAGTQVRGFTRFPSR